MEQQCCVEMTAKQNSEPTHQTMPGESKNAIITTFEMDQESLDGKKTCGGNCRQRVTWFCMGFVIGCLVWICVLMALYGFPSRPTSSDMSENHSCKNSTELSGYHEQLVHHVTCGSDCPTNCLNNTCKRVAGGQGQLEDICTCQHTCDTGYRLLNLTTKHVCQPECCPLSHGDSPVSQCCPLGTVTVTTDTQEQLCCPPHLPHHIHHIPPEVLRSSENLPSRAMDLCFKGNQAGLPSKPQLCTYQTY